MSDIPSDVYREIFCRLPAESLFRLMAVCKSWCRIIGDPSFINSRTTNQSSSTLLIRDFMDRRLLMLPLDSLSSTDADAHPTVDLIHLQALLRPNVPFLPQGSNASCNGLILISHYNFTKTWVIWNPLTREYRKLPGSFSSDPEIDMDFNLPLAGVGFGYESANDDYKVVRIDRDLICDDKYKTHVYSLKLNSWKRIGDCPIHEIQSEGVFLNGALHWLSDNAVVVLDLVTEEYHLLPLPTFELGRPPLLDATMDEPMPLLDALGGNLFWSYSNILSDCFCVWMMKEYGVGTSWMKLFSFGGISRLSLLVPVAYFESKGQFLLQHLDHFILVDFEKDSRKEVTIDGLPNVFCSQFFQGSPFRLGGSVAAGGKRKKRRWFKVEAQCRIQRHFA